jgi:aminoglycoside phosphotransferase (APT) family kinase protein
MATAPHQALLTDLRALINEPGNRTVMLDGSRDVNAGLTLLLIPAGADQPQLAVKLATSQAAAEVIDREARLLAELWPRPMPRVKATLPRPAGVFEVDGMLAIATSVVPGIPMRTRYHRYRHLARPALVRADFAAASSWLADLHADSAAEAAPISLLDRIPQLVLDRWPADPRAAALAEMLGPVAARLAAGHTSRTVAHGDFWAGNILLTGNVVTGVVDWPSGQLAGEPLGDVARFALSYALYLDRHTRPRRAVAGHPGLRADGWGAGIRYAIGGEHWFGRVVRDFVAGALDRLGAPARLWRDVLLAGVAEVAVTADHPDFAARHRDLALQLISEVRS